MALPLPSAERDPLPHPTVYDFRLRAGLGEPPAIWRRMSAVAGTAIMALLAAIALL